jgi:putative Mg2+ transporter-C (MgtC) family protein
VISRLVLAAVCSGLIGFEREASQKAAGLRTHTLVGVGAALFTIVSIVGFEGGDEGRVAAQVVTGIGFLGAGAIFRDGSAVSGLTTAAGLWAVAAIGLAAGSGSYFVAVIGTVVVMTVLLALRSADAAVARRLAQPRPTLRIHLTSAGALNSVVKFIRKLDQDATQVDFQRGDDGQCFVVIAVDSDRADMVSEMISVHKSVDRVEKLNVLHRPPGGTSPG